MTGRQQAGLLALALFLLDFALVSSGATKGADHYVLAHTRIGASWVPAAVLLTTLGAGWIRAIAAVLAAIGLIAFHRRRDAILLLAAWGGGALLVEGVKPLVGRLRPDLAYHLVTAHAASFPSGHATGAMLLYPLIGSAFAGRRGAWGGVALALLIGLTRILLGVHWTSDVAGGWLLGGGIALLVSSEMRGRPSSACTEPATRR